MFKFKKIYKLCSAFEKLAQEDLNFGNIVLKSLDIDPDTFEFGNLQPLLSEVDLKAQIEDMLGWIDDIVGSIKKKEIFIVRINNIIKDEDDTTIVTTHSNYFVDSEVVDEIQILIDNYVRQWRDDISIDLLNKANVFKSGFYLIDLDEIFQFLQHEIYFDPQNKADDEYNDEEKENNELNKLEEKIKNYLNSQQSEDALIIDDINNTQFETVFWILNKFGITVNNYFDELYYYSPPQENPKDYMLQKYFFFVDSNFNAPKTNYVDFANNFPKNIKTLLDHVIESRDEEKFVSFVEEFLNYFDKEDFQNIEEAATHIIQSGYYINKFIRSFPDMAKKFENIIINSKDPKLVYEFALNASDVDFEKLQEIIINNDKMSPNLRAMYISDFARNIPESNIYKLQKALIKDGINESNLSSIEDFINNIPEANIEIFEDAVINTKDGFLITSFAEGVRDADIQKLQQAIIDLQSPEWASHFADSVFGADVEKLRQIK